MFHIANEGALDDVPVERVRDFESQWYDYMAANMPELLANISETGELTDEAAGQLMDAVSGVQADRRFGSSLVARNLRQRHAEPEGHTRPY